MNPLKKIFLFVWLNTFFLVPVFAQNARDDFWVCPVFESNWYSVSKVALGGGAALGYGNGVSLGLKVVYCDDMDEFRTVEVNFLLRFYPFRMTGSESLSRLGLFLQLNGGPVIFAHNEDDMDMPTKTGTLSAGLSLGWRFHIGRWFFIEPSVRGGYPYMAGAGLSAGLRF